MLSLRTVQGIDSGYFERQFRQKFRPMEELLTRYEAHGLAARTERGWHLTPRGFFRLQRHHRLPAGGGGPPAAAKAGAGGGRGFQNRTVRTGRGDRRGLLLLRAMNYLTENYSVFSYIFFILVTES